MKPARILRLVVLLLLGAMTLTSCRFDVYSLPLPGGADTGDDPMTVTVEFADVLDLVPQSTVKVADVSVGKVTAVNLEGTHAEVELEISNDVDLPANATAAIRQTSLLGEKFVSLAPPESGASSDRLADNDEIPLERTGRNPEVEEVLSALSLVLNGGGVAQLKTISHELSLALEGNEGSAKSVLHQLSTLIGRLEQNKGDIVHAIEAVNRLAISVEKQMPAIDAALEELPAALDSLDRQRDDLVKMLKALADLSDVGVRVIRASKESTISSFRDLEPVLAALADAGDALPKSLQIFFTYPFPDSMISRDPQTARNLHMGDYVNLSLQMDIDLGHLLSQGPVGGECIKLSDIKGGAVDLSKLCQGALDAIAKCYANPSLATCNLLPPALKDTLCDTAPLPLLCGRTSGGTSGGSTGGGTPLQNLQDALGGLLRPAPGSERRPTYGDLMEHYDPDLVALLVPGVTR
jgi:phospholipid/cholesterol/gamma-HCH transport system substrate-binding protein